MSNVTNKSNKVRKLVMLSLFIAILIVLNLTGIGFIRMPWGISITIMHIPVIIAAITMGPIYGGIVGGAFGIISMLEATFRGGAADILFSPTASGNPLGSIFMCIVPRIVLGVVAALVFKVIMRYTKNSIVSAGVAAAFATFLHSAMVLLSLSIIFSAFPLKEVIAIIVGINAIVEVVAAIVISIALVKPLLSAQRRIMGS